MNILEYEMIEILKKLRDEFGVFEIKAEYENEGSRQTELMRLKDVTEKVTSYNLKNRWCGSCYRYL